MRLPVLAVLLGSLASAYSGTVRAQISDDLVRIGVLNDQSGLYADFGGPGSVIAARMAVEDSFLWFTAEDRSRQSIYPTNRHCCSVRKTD